MGMRRGVCLSMFFGRGLERWETDLEIRLRRGDYAPLLQDRHI